MNWNDQGNPEPCTPEGCRQKFADELAREVIAQGMADIDAMGYMVGCARHRWESDRHYRERILAMISHPSAAGTLNALKAIPGVRHVAEDRELKMVAIRIGWWRWLWPWSVRRVKRYMNDTVPAGVLWKVKACWR